MTKKDYARLAQVIAAVKSRENDPDMDAGRALRMVTNGLANAFEEGNERFDRDRFWTACGF